MLDAIKNESEHGMMRRFSAMPLLFWFRLEVVATMLWFIIASLWHWTALVRAMAEQDIRQIAFCQSHHGIDLGGCLDRAATQLDNNRFNAIPLALSESAMQIVFLWLIGSILLFGVRWAVKALD